ncbi:hypothetical protein P9112_011890 [Eukaryota sp. TZLM1-RC]
MPQSQHPVRLTQSLFPHRYSTVVFLSEHDDDQDVPSFHISDKPVYFKQTTNVRLIKNIFLLSGCTSTKKSNLFSVKYGKVPSPESFKKLHKFQKVNHFPGTFQLGNKACLSRNMASLSRRHGRRNFEFVPKTFLLPEEASALKKFVDSNRSQKWIKKPKSGSNGVNIRMVPNINELNFSKLNCIMQQYIQSYLIDGFKFDCRLYVLVTSVDPLKVYVFNNGLARFATMRYSKNSNNKFMHLTNFSIQKNRKGFIPNHSVESDGQGSKWSLQALMSRLESMGVDVGLVWSRITDLILKTIISAEGEINTRLKMLSQLPEPCFELFGFDVLLDRELKPWLIEVNTSPSMNQASPIDRHIKSTLWSSILTCLRVSPFDSAMIAMEREEQKKHRLLCSTKRTGRFNRTNFNMHQGNSWLERLNPNELEVICNYEDEKRLARGFSSLFPTLNSRYYSFFSFTRHNNTLLRKWMELKKDISSAVALERLRNIASCI